VGENTYGLPLTAGGIFRAALELYRRYPFRVAVLALIVFLPVELLEELVGERFATPSDSILESFLKVLPQLIGWALTLLAEITYAGLMDLTADAVLEDQPAPGVLDACRHLPYGRLLLVAALAGALALVGFSLFLVPGLIVVVLTCISGTVAIRDRRGPRAIIARSARLVRPRWQLVSVVYFVPAIAGAVAEEAIHHALGQQILSTLVTSALLHVTIYAVGGVAIAILGVSLLDEDEAGKAGRQKPANASATFS
jgi:hypothetical protein